MGSLSARFDCVKAGVVGVIVLVALVTPAISAESERETDQPISLCSAGEMVLFSCALRSKQVSVCGQAAGRSLYRFGRPGRIELQSGNLRYAIRPFSGGGESQVYFERDGYRYILFDRTVRRNFGSQGRNDAAFSSGLAIHYKGRALSSARCGGVMISSSLADYMPEGSYIPH